jgi:hypothetical protein
LAALVLNAPQDLQASMYTVFSSTDDSEAGTDSTDTSSSALTFLLDLSAAFTDCLRFAGMFVVNNRGPTISRSFVRMKKCSTGFIFLHAHIFVQQKFFYYIFITVLILAF